MAKDKRYWQDCWKMNHCMAASCISDPEWECDITCPYFDDTSYNIQEMFGCISME